jgi:hypothetical protein
MVINQRGTVNTPVTPANTQYTLDRFNSNLTQSGKYSIQQSTTAPTGFGFSLLATSLSAFSIGASDFFDFFQPIEGFNFADLAFGTAGAKTITISLWINASIAGTYGGYLINAAGNRTCVFSYSVPVANTWTYVTATVPGDTSGSWVGATNGIGIYVVPVSLGAGSSVTTSTTNTWGSTAFRGVTGQVNMVGTNGATVYITGFQLEVGVTATSFDYRPYSTELQLCQRYFQTVNSFTGIGVNTTTVNGLVTALSTMRTEPGVSLTGPYSLSDYFASDYLQSSASVSAVFGAVPMAVVIGLSNFTGITVGRTYLTRLNNANAITLSAEL